MTYQQLKFRAYFAWQILLGKYEPAPITPFGIKAKHEALKLSLNALENIGKRPRGGSVSARAAHAFIVTQLRDAGVRIE